MGARTQVGQDASWTSAFFIYFVLPVLAFAGTALYLSGRNRIPRGTPAPPPAENTLQVQGLAGLLAGEHGARVELRLLPLHADQDRQRFDQVQLRRRFELGVGEPWRLEIRYHGDPGRPYAEQARLDLTQLRVTGVEGDELVGIPAPAFDGMGLRDPLAELLSRAPRELAAGQRAQRILWGPAPTEGSLVQGLLRVGEDGTARALFAPTNPSSGLALTQAELRQDREVALFHADSLPEYRFEGLLEPGGELPGEGR
jgi:hypothetical protein